MWDRRKLLLVAIVFTALYYNVTSESAKLLDMAPDAVDDLYNGCREKAMEEFIHSGLLRQELNHSEGFQKAWSQSAQCSKLIPGGVKEHTTALMAFATNEGLETTFNNAVETLGVNVSTYENHFHFKSLHFLLMDSMKLIQNLNPEQCKTMYLSSEDKYTAQTGSKVRFGGFNMAYSSYEALKRWVDLDGQVIFNITSCFFVNLGNHTCSGEKGMLLLSPAEEFTVEEVNERTDDINDSEYTEIVLRQPKLNSTHNCYIFSRSPAGGSTQWLVSVLVALFLLLFNC